MKIEDGLTLLNKDVGDIFSRHGFIANKKKNEYQKSQGNFVDSFCIQLSKKGNGELFHHLTLSHTNKKIDELSNKVELQNIKNLDDRFLPLKTLEKLIKSRGTIGITDWKMLYAEKKIEPKFLWFSYLNEMRSKFNYKKDYEEMIDLGLDWFSKIKNESYLRDQLLKTASTTSLEKYLSIIKLTSPSTLASEYLRITTIHAERHGWDKNEVHGFYEILKDTVV